MKAGDTLLVMPGNYTGGVTLGPSYAGTSGQVTTIRSATPQGAVINTSATAGITLTGTSYVVVEGFKIDGTTKEGIGAYSSSNLTIRGNEISHSGLPQLNAVANGIELSGTTSSTVAGNYLHDNSNDGMALLTSAGATPVKSSGNVVSGNISTNNGRVFIRSATGILVTGDDNTITGNTTYANEDTGIQVSAAAAAAPPASGNRVTSNVSYGNLDHGIDLSQAPSTSVLGNSVYKNATAGIDAESTSTGITVANNISVDNAIGSTRTTGQIRVDAGSQTGTLVTSNLVFNSSNGALYTWGMTTYSSVSSFQTASGQGASDLSGNPQWVNPGAADFHLMSGSPAIDNADTTVVGWPSCDKENVCPHNDRGALEFVPPAATAPAAPTGVQAVAGDGSASVSWTAPGDGGSPITGYTVTASPGGASATVNGSTTSATVAGLANGTSYTFTVKATNAVGAGPASAPSNAVVPTAAQTAPGAPTGVLAVAGHGDASVSWTAPGDGGSPITGYTVTASPGGASASVNGSTTSATVAGLANGTSYTFTVKATNAVGAGPASAPSNAVVPTAAQTAPGAPTGVLAVAGHGDASVSWTAPGDGGSPITGYTVTASPGGASASVNGSTTSATVAGLANGTSYTFTVKATNAVGAGPASAPSNAVVPTAAQTAPGAPTGVLAVAGHGDASVSWTAPGDGGSPITGYTVTASPGGASATVNGSTTSATVAGLANGTSYTFTVKATNAVGAGPASAPSNAVVPTAAQTAPGAPTGVLAVAGHGDASVSWTAPGDGGSPITGYTVTASPGGASATVNGSTTSATVAGLANGTSYTFTVKATNAVGTGPASAPSNAVVPTSTSASVDRWGGANRYQTSALISAKSFPAGVGVAYVASGVQFPDALSAAPVAGMTKGPVLLAGTNALDRSVTTELKRLRPAKIVVVGSAGAVSDAVARSLAGYTTGSVVRWGGANRYQTSALISAKSFPAGVGVAYVASGLQFPDALSGAPVAGMTKGPVLLAGTNALDRSVTTELKRLRPAKIVVLGSAGAVSDGVATTLAGYTTGPVVRWGGANRFDTSALISAKSFPSNVGVVYVVSGLDFPDGLAGAPVAGMTRGPVVLAGTNSLASSVTTELKRLRPAKIVILGSSGVVSDAVRDQLAAFVR